MKKAWNKNMYSQIIKNLEDQLSIKELTKIKNTSLHLGVFTEP